MNGYRARFGSLRRLIPLLAVLAACGCDHVTRHKVLVSVLDGYPTLPPVEELCREQEQRVMEAYLRKEPPVTASKVNAPQRSQHRPFMEKRCNDCHRADKGGASSSEEGLLVKPREELCFVCHKDLLKGKFHHGPAAVGDCLACHLPHDSANPSLLVASKETLCAKCHTERRLAARMHDQFVQKDLPCVNCHDPHSGESPYFLK